MAYGHFYHFTDYRRAAAHATAALLSKLKHSADISSVSYARRFHANGTGEVSAGRQHRGMAYCECGDRSGEVSRKVKREYVFLTYYNFIRNGEEDYSH